MSPHAFLADPVAALSHLVREAPALAAPLRPLPLWAHALVLAAGIAVLVAGARWRRPVALVGGAALGALAGLAAAGLLGLRGPIPPAAGALALGAGALLFPPAFPFALGALPGAFAGARLDPVGIPAVSAALGAILLGGLALLAARHLAAATASFAGAGIAALAVLAAAHHLPALAVVARRPAMLLGAVVVLTVAGTALQVPRAWGGGGGGKKRRKAAAPAGAEPSAA